MIESNMREYPIFYITPQIDEYGQKNRIAAAGKAKIAITLYTQSNNDNINYKDCNYIGLTYNKEITDSHIVQMGNKKLKVKLVNPCGRMVQLVLGDYE